MDESARNTIIDNLQKKVSVYYKGDKEQNIQNNYASKILEIREKNSQIDKESTVILLEVVNYTIEDQSQYVPNQKIINLEYKINSISSFKNDQNRLKIENLNYGAYPTVFVVLRKEGEYYVSDYVSIEKPKKVINDQVIIKAKFNVSTGKLIYGRGGIYHLNQKKRPVNTDKLTAGVKIGVDYSAVVTRLYVNGEALYDPIH